MRGDQEVTVEIRTAQVPLPDRNPPENDIENGGTRLALPNAPVSAGQARGER